MASYSLTVHGEKRTVARYDDAKYEKKSSEKIREKKKEPKKNAEKQYRATKKHVPKKDQKLPKKAHVPKWTKKRVPQK